MRSKFSGCWKASKQPRKQRKYLKNAPLHIQQRLIRAAMSEELRKKFGKRSMGVRKSDKVKVMRGEFAGKIGKVNLVDRKRQGVYIDGIERNRRDGAKACVMADKEEGRGVHASALSGIPQDGARFGHSHVSQGGYP